MMGREAKASQVESSRVRIPSCAGIFGGSSHTKIGTPVATLPRTWRYSVSTVTGRPDVSIL